jgi:hypothetical protein
MAHGLRVNTSHHTQLNMQTKKTRKKIKVVYVVLFSWQSVDRKEAFSIFECMYVSNNKQKKSFSFSSDTINHHTRTFLIRVLFVCITKSTSSYRCTTFVPLYSVFLSDDSFIKSFFFLDIKILYLCVWVDMRLISYPHSHDTKSLRPIVIYSTLI